MLKGHVFSKQLFANPIFALFINTFLNGENGVSNNYKNGMQPTYSGSTLTIDSGAVCIQGRFLEEDTSTQIATGTNNAYCKLVIEIDLDKQNTESQLNQASYKVITSASGYPTLTQTNIVRNVSGIYQYELARFRTSSSGIMDFQDMRTFLDFDSIFEEIRQEYGEVLQELEEELANVVDGSDYLLKSAGGTVKGQIIANGGVKGNVTGNVTGSSGSCTGNSATTTRLQTARTIGISGGATGTATSFNGSANITIPITGLNMSKANSGTLPVARGGTGNSTGNAATATKLQTARSISLSGDVTGSASFDGSKNVTITTDLNNIAILTGTIAMEVHSDDGYTNGSKEINYPSGFNKNNCVVIAAGVGGSTNGNTEYAFGFLDNMSDAYVLGAIGRTVKLRDSHIEFRVHIQMAASAITRNYKIVLMKI